MKILVYNDRWKTMKPHTKKRDELNTENKLNDDKIWEEILNSLFPNFEANMKICMKKGKFLHIQYKNNKIHHTVL